MIAGVVNIAILPEHIIADVEIAVAAPTETDGLMLIVSEEPEPHELTPVQIIVPIPLPTVSEIVDVVLEPLQPVPRTVQL